MIIRRRKGIRFQSPRRHYIVPSEERKMKNCLNQEYFDIIIIIIIERARMQASRRLVKEYDIRPE